MALDARGQVCRVDRFKQDWQRTVDRIVAATGAAVALVDLAATIQRGEIALPCDGPLRAELEALEWQATARDLWQYGFPPGMTGDLVMALALAIRQGNVSSTSRHGRRGAALVVEDETFEQRVRRKGSWLPGD